ncbi:AraC family transcriptional regulator [Planotetraspora thailandica]|uniref:AraC family transcriptional regulator n=1 Tax=Planotetraspora thailandica TaxID=487172 RepID=A0A8J3Y273_9ACTN|nr:AraC family transcriptional regulator [Planotetraspora thailandica]GII59525.1 AraC family transcriptional regulator [Planotetraspora thailandica]
MDRNGHIVVTDVPYRASVGAPPGVEVVDFVGLPARARSHDVDLYAPKRLAFHELITVRSGTLRYSVDFTEHVLIEGAWMWSRPGQIQQFRSDLTAAEGTVVLFERSFLSPGTVEVARVDQSSWQRPLIPEGTDRAVHGVLDLLESEYRSQACPSLEVHVEVLRHLLAVLVLRLTQAHGGVDHDGADVTEAFRRFQSAVDRDFVRTRRVEDFARDLGYSVRTLTRATRAAAGCGAKRFINDRVLLEAKRRLVHTDLAVATVGERLGFSEATVFTKFFRQRTGETPAAFRAHSRGIA